MLDAARAEFAERGYRAARVDVIAERAELTRGAVYSNFPGKRALYFAVLAEMAEDADEPSPVPPGATAGEALGAFARAWVARLPLADTDLADGPARLGLDLAGEILAGERTRRPYTHLLHLDALLLGLALERLAPPEPGRRRVRVAEAALTILHGARQLAGTAPGFVDPFTVVQACEQLADLDGRRRRSPGAGLEDRWLDPVPSVPVHPTDLAWDPPDVTDAVRDEPAELAGDGVVVLLGLHRLALAEHALRAAPPDRRVTAVLVTGDPGELAPLARLAVTEVTTGIRRVFPRRRGPTSRWSTMTTGCWRQPAASLT